jgi:adenosylcobinamide kinase/adenosylcobinamide-phosphate guanylyltransferase
LGGARSGKSRRAEQIARGFGDERVYLATSEPFDDEMRERVAHHRADRDAHGWITVEEPLALAEALAAQAEPGRAILVECLTTWLGNLMHHERDVPASCAELVTRLGTLPCHVILVGNEVGLGIVPENALARRFRDHAGRLHQDIAAIADRVELVVAGLPMVVKG